MSIDFSRIFTNSLLQRREISGCIARSTTCALMQTQNSVTHLPLLLFQPLWQERLRATTTLHTIPLLREYAVADGRFHLETLAATITKYRCLSPGSQQPYYYLSGQCHHFRPSRCYHPPSEHEILRDGPVSPRIPLCSLGRSIENS